VFEEEKKEENENTKIVAYLAFKHLYIAYFCSFSGIIFPSQLRMALFGIVGVVIASLVGSKPTRHLDESLRHGSKDFSYVEWL